MRSSLTKPLDWTATVAPVEPDSYRAIWFKFRNQRAAVQVVMDPFTEPVRLVLPA